MLCLSEIAGGSSVGVHNRDGLAGRSTSFGAFPADFDLPLSQIGHALHRGGGDLKVARSVEFIDPSSAMCQRADLCRVIVLVSMRHLPLERSWQFGFLRTGQSIS